MAAMAVGCKDAVNDAITDNQVYIQRGFYDKYDTSYIEGEELVPVAVPVM